MTHRLLPEPGVLVVEVTQPLRAQDFDALAATADTWLATHDALPGVVLHARAFPGWENIDGLLHHIRFVRDHHRKVRRVALAVDSTLADLAPRVAEHFGRAELRHFGYDELDDAVAWAAGPSGGVGRRPRPRLPFPATRDHMAASPRVLVSYATAVGSTAGIAERIADVLRTAGRDVVCRPADPDLDLAGFDALVMGSAVHDMAWLPSAVTMLHRAAASGCGPV